MIGSNVNGKAKKTAKGKKEEILGIALMTGDFAPRAA